MRLSRDAMIEVVRRQGMVPSHLPGTNYFVQEFGQRYGIPLEATRGGAETMYPEYKQKLKSMPASAKIKRVYSRCVI